MTARKTEHVPLVYGASWHWAVRVGSRVGEVRDRLRRAGTVPPASDSIVGLRYIQEARTPDTMVFPFPRLLAASMSPDSDDVNLEWHIAGGYPDCNRGMFCGAAVLGRGETGLVEIVELDRDGKYANHIESVVEDMARALAVDDEVMNPLLDPESAMVVRGLMRSGHNQGDALQSARGLVLVSAMDFDSANPDIAAQYWQLEPSA